MAQAVDYGSGEGGVRVARAEFGGDPRAASSTSPTTRWPTRRATSATPTSTWVTRWSQLMMAQRGYQANLAVVERATNAYQAALQLGKG